MHIVFYNTARLPIPPPDYGGVQRIIYWLGKALIQLGHQVTLVARPGSHIPGAETRAIPDGDDDPRAALRLVPDSADIIHFWSLRSPESNKPFVVSMQGNAQ